MLITACQQSCRKVMFSVASVSPSSFPRGCHVTITHDTSDLTIQGLTALSPVQGHPQPWSWPPGHEGSLYGDMGPHCTKSRPGPSP